MWQVAGLREERGKEKEALEMADSLLKEIEKENGGAKLEAQVWLEKSLIWQHLLESRMSEGNQGVDEARNEMMMAIKQAEMVMEDGGVDRGDETLRIDVFLGKAAMEVDDYEGAKQAYERAIEVVNDETKTLEFKAHLCEPVILLGEVKEGVRLAQQTDGEFDEGVGEELKNGDYITWAIWKSGLWIRVAKALKKVGKLAEYEELVMGKLTEAEEYLNEDKIETKKWTEKPFEIRLDQIKEIREK